MNLDIFQQENMVGFAQIPQQSYLQYLIQSYFETGKLVWDLKLRPPNSQKCKN